MHLNELKFAPQKSIVNFIEIFAIFSCSRGEKRLYIYICQKYYLERRARSYGGKLIFEFKINCSKYQNEYRVKFNLSLDALKNILKQFLKDDCSYS